MKIPVANICVAFWRGEWDSNHIW